MSSSNFTAGSVDPAEALADASLPFSRTKDGVVVRVRLTPKAGRNAVGKQITDAAGTVFLKASVTAVPEKGKANKALLKLLSKTWGVAMQRLTLITGAKGRNKTVAVSGDATETEAMLKTWLQSHQKG